MSLKKCPRCNEAFGRRINLVAHFRHEHTNYDGAVQHYLELLSRKDRNTNKARLMARNHARAKIEDEINEMLGYAEHPYTAPAGIRKPDPRTLPQPPYEIHPDLR